MAPSPERADASTRPSRPAIKIEGVTDPPQRRDSADRGSARPVKPRRRRQHSFQGRSWGPDENMSPSIEEKPAVATAPSAKSLDWCLKTRILHPSESKPSHSVDIVVVYMFNGSQGDQGNADLALFQSYEQAQQAEREPPSKQHRADVERELKKERMANPGLAKSPSGKDGTLHAPDAIRSTPTTKGSVRPSPASRGRSASNADGVFMTSKPLPMPGKVNWLMDSDMLPNIIPEARIIGVGFDIQNNADVPIDFETAAEQLCNYLAIERANCSTRPILFIGHAYGGIIIEQALVTGACQDTKSKPILENTAAVFFFSCPILGSDTTSRLLAELYGLSPDARFFTDMGASSAKLRRLTDEFNAKVMQKDTRMKSDSGDQPKTKLRVRKGVVNSGDMSRRTGFPIIHVTSAEFSSQRKAERAAEKLKVGRAIDRLDDPESIVVLTKDFRSAIQFSGPKDQDFQNLAKWILSAVHTRQFLDAATGRLEDMESLINKQGVNVNLRDRWGQTALHIAIQRASEPEPMVRLLLRKGSADPSPKDRRLNTPLHYAVERNDITIVRELLDAHADVNAENDALETPINLAARHKSSRRIAKLLRQQPLDLVEGPAVGPKQSSGRKPTPPQSKEGKLACKSFQVTATEVFSFEGTDHHWSLPVSVQEVIYGPSTLENLLRQVRPKDVAQKTPLCRWLHIHENNMMWVEHLFAKLGYCGSIWAGRGHMSQVPHIRAIAPHVAPPRNQDHQNEPLAIFMPYLSYEVNKRQAKMSEFTMKTQLHYNLDSLMKQWEELFEESYILHSPKSIADRLRERTVDASGSADRNRGGSESDNARNVEGSDSASQHDIPERKATLREPISDLESESSHSESDTSIVDEYGLDKEDKSLITAYLNDPPSLHVRRTLDQYYYHMLASTKQRDKDQVVTRWAKSECQETHNILMVDQLWLWLFRAEDDTDIIISSFPDRTGFDSRDTRSMRSMDKLRDLVLDPIGHMRDPIQSTAGLVFRILATCSNIFDRCQEFKMLQFLQAFEISIGKVSDKETSLFKKFQKRSTKLHALSKEYKDFENRKRDLLEQLLDIGKETKLLVEIKDILDEIKIILTILQTQRSVLLDSGLEKFALGLGGDDRLSQFEDARRIIETSTADFSRMQTQAEAVQSSLNSLMDLKQKAANAWEARSAREGALATAKQGNTMLVFTVVTIIFLPLSFMASFFALDVASFPQDPKTGQTNWPLRLVSGFIFGISFAVSIPFIMIAFNLQSMALVWKSMLNDRLIRVLLYILGILRRLRIKKLNRKRKQWSRQLRRRQGQYVKYQYGKKVESESSSDNESDHDRALLSDSPYSSDSTSVSDVDSDHPGLCQRAILRIVRASKRIRNPRQRAEDDEESVGKRNRLRRFTTRMKTRVADNEWNG